MRGLQSHRITRANLEPVCGPEVTNILQPFVFEQLSLLASFIGATVRVITSAAAVSGSTFRNITQGVNIGFSSYRVVQVLTSSINSGKRTITALTTFDGSSARIITVLSVYIGSSRRIITTAATYAASTVRAVILDILLYFKGFAIKKIYSGNKYIVKAYRGATKLFDKTI